MLELQTVGSFFEVLPSKDHQTNITTTTDNNNDAEHSSKDHN